jgi:hypothetical protein
MKPPGLAGVLPTDHIAAAIVADQKKHPPAELPAAAPLDANPAIGRGA